MVLLFPLTPYLAAEDFSIVEVAPRGRILIVEDVAVVFRSGRLGAVLAWIYFRNKRKIVGMKIEI